MEDRVTCSVCDGDGKIEYEIPKPQSFTRDIGFIDTAWDNCYNCNGDGDIPIDDWELNTA